MLIDWGTVSAGSGRRADTVPAATWLRRRCWGVAGLPDLRLSSVSIRLRIACVRQRQDNALHRVETDAFVYRYQLESCDSRNWNS